MIKVFQSKYLHKNPVGNIYKMQRIDKIKKENNLRKQ